MTAAGLLAILLPVVALAVMLAIALARQIAERNALAAWLERPEPQGLPDGRGAWRGIFSRLQSLHKAQRRQAAAFADELAHFRTAMRALPDGVVLLDATGRIEWLNPAAGRHFSLDPARDRGMPIGQLVRASAFQALLAAYRTKRQTHRGQLSDGTCELALVLVPFAAQGTLLVSADIGTLRRSERQQRDFVANVSHELRTPLTVIGGFLEQFLGPQPPSGETAQEFLRLMAGQTERMNRLVADLLTLAQLENDPQPPRDEDIDMVSLIGELCSTARALSAGQHVVECLPPAAGDLRGSAEELRSAFGNLVLNAVRYTPPGGKITLSWQIIDGCPTFSVSDTGIGIPAEHIPRLTERFYRVDKGRSVATGGTGLGLAIVQEILVRHGATLTIDSQPGRGSTFSVRLPDWRLESLANDKSRPEPNQPVQG